MGVADNPLRKANICRHGVATWHPRRSHNQVDGTRKLQRDETLRQDCGRTERKVDVAFRRPLMYTTRKCPFLGVHEFVHETGTRLWYFMGFRGIDQKRKTHIFHDLGFYGIA